MALGRIKTTTLILASSVGLSACMYPGYNGDYYGDRYVGQDYPDECYDEKGRLYEDCEDASYVARRGYGYGNIYLGNSYGPYGWYDGFYYPGYSFYIYDRLGHRHRWRDDHRTYWEGRRHRSRGYRRGRGYRNGHAAGRDHRRGEGRRGRGGRRGNAIAGSPGGNRGGAIPGGRRGGGNATGGRQSAGGNAAPRPAPPPPRARPAPRPPRSTARPARSRDSRDMGQRRPD